MGVQGHGVRGNSIAFGLLKRNDRIYVEVTPDYLKVLFENAQSKVYQLGMTIFIFILKSKKKLKTYCTDLETISLRFLLMLVNLLTK